MNRRHAIIQQNNDVNAWVFIMFFALFLLYSKFGNFNNSNLNQNEQAPHERQKEPLLEPEMIFTKPVKGYDSNSNQNEQTTHERKKEPLLEPEIKNPQMFIEEEHHEVIPHWVKASKENNWKKADLIHIDAHSDMDYPDRLDVLPLGHPPESKEDIAGMMQRNDQFIQAAIIAQMIRKVYLIFPTWTSNHSIAYNVSIGITQDEEVQKRQLCICFDVADVYCRRKRLDASFGELDISPKDCPPLWNYTHVELLSSDASTVLRHSKKYAIPLNSTTPLILDIDEDYFGVHLVGHDLMKTKLSMEDSLYISDVISSLICLQTGTARNEMLADVWFRSHLTELQQNCHQMQCISNFLYNQTLPNECQIALHRSKQRLLATKEILCSDISQTEYGYDILSMFLLNQTPEQLQALKRVGICLEQAWKTFSLEAYPQLMVLCLGHNRPGESIVPEHIPEFDELRGLVKNFTRILRALPKKPMVITVARSSRDGYIARWLQPTVESLIIKAAKLVFGLGDEDVHYSNYLAGGLNGWQNRFL